ncbi:hypothetical protein PT285_07970 [Lactobacillus sp. ESL0791]|uniref:hypothetical protein n=1 Tax=Lactobacillus sp. ESL0791 TaxID=2983234 RepID=UPI0023F8F934|nr:hypothetical protein [Lactobacillus sp. ESL0791]MDF7639335.1 hypothetical protein [Lactobacillus sp. ESL0791]
MSRLVRVGAGGEEIGWHEALKDLRADDVLLLEPGFYELPQGITLCDVTIKGSGSLPEDTTILGYVDVAIDSRYVTLENLCINTNNERNSLYVPPEADSYLSLRNCLIKGYGSDTATIALNGKVTLELYSVKILAGSVSVYQNANFRLEVNDSVLANPSDEYCALALEGKGTAIINNSQVHGSIDTFAATNAELDLNNSVVDYLLLYGQTWLNMLNSEVLAKDDASLYIGDECWINIINCKFNGGIYTDKQPHIILQNIVCDRLVGVGDSQLTVINSVIMAHADFQDNAVCSVRRTTFNSDGSYQYFLALSNHARLDGHDLILNANGTDMAVQDDARLEMHVLESEGDHLRVECQQKPNVHILGAKWTIINK